MGFIYNEETVKPLGMSNLIYKDEAYEVHSNMSFAEHSIFIDDSDCDYSEYHQREYIPSEGMKTVINNNVYTFHRDSAFIYNDFYKGLPVARTMLPGYNGYGYTNIVAPDVYRGEQKVTGRYYPYAYNTIGSVRTVVTRTGLSKEIQTGGSFNGTGLAIGYFDTPASDNHIIDGIYHGEFHNLYVGTRVEISNNVQITGNLTDMFNGSTEVDGIVSSVDLYMANMFRDSSCTYQAGYPAFTTDYYTDNHFEVENTTNMFDNATVEAHIGVDYIRNASDMFTHAQGSTVINVRGIDNASNMFNTYTGSVNIMGDLRVNNATNMFAYYNINNFSNIHMNDASYAFFHSNLEGGEGISVKAVNYAHAFEWSHLHNCFVDLTGAENLAYAFQHGHVNLNYDSPVLVNADLGNTFSASTVGILHNVVFSGYNYEDTFWTFDVNVDNVVVDLNYCSGNINSSDFEGSMLTISRWNSEACNIPAEFKTNTGNSVYGDYEGVMDNTVILDRPYLNSSFVQVPGDYYLTKFNLNVRYNLYTKGTTNYLVRGEAFV